MKNLLIILNILLFASISIAGDVWVKGYFGKDGTYVQGHHRTTPDQNRYNNYSSQGNVNPYTWEKGSQRNEFSSPPKYNRPRRQSNNFNQFDSFDNNFNQFDSFEVKPKYYWEDQ